MNNAATIRIFIKGLKNAHNLAARIKIKDPHTLIDAVTEEEKLNTAQQLTATIIPSSTVNMMSNEEDQCFQCQELRHIAWHCPHISCHECDEFRNMDCPYRIPPSGTLAPHHKAHRNCHNRSTSRNHWEDWERRDQSRSQPRYSKHCSSSHCALHRVGSQSQ